MKLEEALSNLLSVPRQHFDEGTPIYSLMMASGYFGNYVEISEARIHRALVEHPGYVDEWMQLSEDKRTTGWYIICPREKNCEVGYNPAKGEIGSIATRHYTDEVEACAAFIKLEAEDIRLRHCVD